MCAKLTKLPEQGAIHSRRGAVAITGRPGGASRRWVNERAHRETAIDREQRPPRNSDRQLNPPEMKLTGFWKSYRCATAVLRPLRCTACHPYRRPPPQYTYAPYGRGATPYRSTATPRTHSAAASSPHVAGVTAFARCGQDSRRRVASRDRRLAYVVLEVPARLEQHTIKRGRKCMRLRRRVKKINMHWRSNDSPLTPKLAHAKRLAYYGKRRTCA